MNLSKMEIDEEYVNKLINEAIEFDKKMETPTFVEKMKIEEEKMKNLDLRTIFSEGQI